MPYSLHWIWRQRQGTTRLEPKQAPLPASLSAHKSRRHHWQSLRHADQPSRCLPMPCGQCGGRDSAGRCRRRAYGKTNTMPHWDANPARICAMRKFGCKNSRHLCRNGGFAHPNYRREIRRLRFSDGVYRQHVKVVPINSTICAHRHLRYSQAILAHPLQS